MEGYKIPPAMFSEDQTNTLILAEQLVLKNKDAAFIGYYTEAVVTIKAVLKQAYKDKANLSNSPKNKVSAKFKQRTK